MTGKFKTPEGKEVLVIEYDEPNNILRAKFPHDRTIWVGKTEYKTWTKIGGETKAENFVHVPDIPAQMTEEQAGEILPQEPLVTDVEAEPVTDSAVEEPIKIKKLKTKKDI